MHFNVDAIFHALRNHQPENNACSLLEHLSYTVTHDPIGSRRVTLCHCITSRAVEYSSILQKVVVHIDIHW
jgi:hypothetical protein